MDQPIRRFKAEFFKALAHPGRIKMLEALREGEKTVAELQVLLNDDEPSSASQHLSILRMKGVVLGRKDGTSVYYSVRDPLLYDLLDLARCIFNNQLSQTHDTLRALDDGSPVAELARAKARKGRHA